MVLIINTGFPIEFVPILGRFIIGRKFLSSNISKFTEKEPIWKTILILVENTLAYFLLGYLAIFLCPQRTIFLVWATVGFALFAPIEYFLQKKHPRFFGGRIPASPMFFTWLVYHAFLFMLFGAFLPH